MRRDTPATSLLYFYFYRALFILSSFVLWGLVFWPLGFVELRRFRVFAFALSFLLDTTFRCSLFRMILIWTTASLLAADASVTVEAWGVMRAERRGGQSVRWEGKDSGMG